VTSTASTDIAGTTTGAAASCQRGSHLLTCL